MEEEHPPLFHLTGQFNRPHPTAARTFYPWLDVLERLLNEGQFGVR